MTPAVEQLVDDYYAWLRGRVSIADVNGSYEITTPFLDRHNDRLQIYAEQEGDGFRLSDDSYIIGDLASSGCPVDTPHRKRLLDAVTRGFGVSLEGDELVVHATEKDFARKKHLLIQAMLAVNDMFMTSKKQVANLFIEDVKTFLDANEIRYTPAVEFTGKSGLRHRFDYVIPKSKTRPERLIRAINNPSRNDTTSLLFAWTDTKEVRPENSTLYAVLNDEQREPSKDVATSLQRYGVSIIPWSQREQFVSALVA